MDQNTFYPLDASTVQLFEASNAKHNALIKRDMAYVPPRNSSASQSGHAQRDDGDAAAARQSLAGFFERRIGDGLASDDHITGRHLARHRVQQPKLERLEWHDPELAFPTQTGSMLTRRTFFSVPIVRSGRPRTAGKIGTTTFHFEFKVITKARPDAQGQPDRKNSPSSALDHARYLEREGAVESCPQGGLPSPGIPSNDKSTNDETARTEAEREADYIEAGAVASSAHDIPLAIFTNISSVQAERIAFWGSVERHERTPGYDQMKIDFSRHRARWNALAADPECPSIFARNASPILAANPAAGSSQIVTGSNDEVRRLMRRHGLLQSPALEGKPGGETPQSKRQTRTHKQQLDEQGFAFSDARCGRVQIRLVGELADEIDHAGRIRILKGMAAEFDKRALPYTAVIHAPNATNHYKNHHFHLIGHDQPAKRFTGLAKDHIPPLPNNPTMAQRAKHDLMHEAIADVSVQNQVGKWDFEVEYTRRDSSRRLKTSTPFAQKKSREVNDQRFIGHLRQRMAELTNDELILCDANRRVDHRSFAAIGIAKEPDEHLGDDLSQREKYGIPTAKGVSNERKHWAFKLHRLAEIRNRRLSLLTEFIELAADPPISLADRHSRTDYNHALEKVAADERKRAEDWYQVFFLRQVVLRAQSRADAVAKTCGAALKTCQAEFTKLMGQAPHAKDSDSSRNRRRKTLLRRTANLKRRRDEADAYLAYVRSMFAPELTHIDELEKQDLTVPDLDAALAHEMRSILRTREQERQAEIAVSRAPEIKPQNNARLVEDTQSVAFEAPPSQISDNAQPIGNDRVESSDREEHSRQEHIPTERDNVPSTNELPNPASVHKKASPVNDPSPRSTHLPIAFAGTTQDKRGEGSAGSDEQGKPAVGSSEATPEVSLRPKIDRASQLERPTWKQITEQAKAARQMRQSVKVVENEPTDDRVSPLSRPGPSPLEQLTEAPQLACEPVDMSEPWADVTPHCPVQEPDTATPNGQPLGSHIRIQKEEPPSIYPIDTPAVADLAPKLQRNNTALESGISRPPVAPDGDTEPPFDIELERRRIRELKNAWGPKPPMLAPGLHPKIDEWLGAERAGEEPRRQLAAEAIVADRNASLVLRRLAPEDQARIRQDARARRTADLLDTGRAQHPRGAGQMRGEDRGRSP